MPFIHTAPKFSVTQKRAKWNRNELKSIKEARIASALSKVPSGGKFTIKQYMQWTGIKTQKAYYDLATLVNRKLVKEERGKTFQPNIYTKL